MRKEYMEKNICFQFQILVLDLKKLTLNFKKKTFELISKANGTNTYLQPEVFGCKEKGSPS